MPQPSPQLAPEPAAEDGAVQQPLTLVMQLKSKEAAAELSAILANDEGPRKKIEAALEKLRTVHFARFVMLPGDPPYLAVITTFDDDFDEYVKSFTRHLGDEFDFILDRVDGRPPKPVHENTKEFVAWVAEHNVPVIGSLFSAYPDKRVPDIINAPED